MYTKGGGYWIILIATFFIPKRLNQMTEVRIQHFLKSTSIPKQLFHITPYENLNNILYMGLHPAVGPRSILIKEVKPAIYLFSSIEAVETALSTWLGNELTEERLVLLEINLPNFIKAYQNKNAPFEFQVLRPIPSKYIKVINDNYDD